MRISARRKNNLKIAAMTSMVIFTLFAVFSGTFAWFNINQSVLENGDNMNVDRLTSVLSRVHFHAQVGTKAITENDVSTNYYLFEKAEYASIEIGDDNIAGELEFNKDSGAYKDWEAKADQTSTLSTYSLLAQDHPILILFDIVPYTSASPSEIKLDFRTGSQYLGFADSVQRSGNPLSSIVQFNAFGLTSSLPSGGSYNSDTQAYSDTYLYGVERGITYDKKWVTISDAETATFDSDGLINIFSNLDAQGNPTSTVYTQIGVVMNYSIESLEFIYNKFLGNEILNENLFFTWDWTMEM